MNDIVDLSETNIIQFSSRIPFYHQLYSYIEAKIKSGEWRHGQPLPSEEELCVKLGVSRTVVRQAISELSRDGLIVKKSGKRSRVARARYYGSLMQDLRGFHEDAKARGQTPTTQVLGLRVIPADEEIADRLKAPKGEPVVMLDRLRFLDNEPVVLVVTYLPERFCPGITEEDLTNRSLYELISSKYGLVISHGFRTIEAVPASGPDARLLGVRAGSPLLLLKSVGLLEDGTPLEYFIARHRGDRSRFQVELVRPR
jgi:DNA-binding GntR family transcriptional regulator